MFDELRQLSAQHQVVTVIGARGVGKTTLAAQLASHWRESGIDVVSLDAGLVGGPDDLDGPLASALGCEVHDLAAHVPENPVRVVIDRCERLHSKPWFAALQERWRSLLSAPASRGRIGLVLFGRPLFRQIAGGDGSPLLNIGTVVTVPPLSREDVAAMTAATGSTADPRAVRAKSGGHARLTQLLCASAMTADTLGDCVKTVAAEQRGYVFELVQDHGTAAEGILRDLLRARRPVQEATLIRTHFGSAYGPGANAMDDLVASGLVAKAPNGDCSVGATILRDVPALADLLQAPETVFPDDPGCLAEASVEVFRIENRLRRFVAEHLAAHDTAWWATRIPPALAGDADARKQAEIDVLGQDRAEFHPLTYLGLGELIDVMMTRDNWDQVFRLVLDVEKEAAQAAARTLLTLRNRIAHSRPLDPDDIELLKRSTRHLGLAHLD